jgi:hypothetical protein
MSVAAEEEESPPTIQLGLPVRVARAISNMRPEEDDPEVPVLPFNSLLVDEGEIPKPHFAPPHPDSDISFVTQSSAACAVATRDPSSFADHKFKRTRSSDAIRTQASPISRDHMAKSRRLHQSPRRELHTSAHLTPDQHNRPPSKRELPERKPRKGGQHEPQPPRRDHSKKPQRKESKRDVRRFAQSGPAPVVVKEFPVSMKIRAEFEVRPSVEPRQAQTVERRPSVARPGWGDVAVKEIPVSVDCDAASLTECEVEFHGDVAANKAGKRVDDSFFTKFRIDGFEQLFGGYKIGEQVEELTEPADSRAVLGVWRKSREVTEPNAGMKGRDHPPLILIRSDSGETRLLPPDEPPVKVVDTFQIQAQRVTTRSLCFRLTRSWV